MHDYNTHFTDFLKAFQNKDFEAANVFLSKSFKEDSKKTLSKLYKQLLYEKEYSVWDFSKAEMPLPYRILLEAIRDNRDEISEASKHISSWSKEQLLQGVANVLEKRNAELKYNAAWQIRYKGADERYLETERQGIYFSTAGMDFQELLERFYLTAPDETNPESTVATEPEAQIETCFQVFTVYHALRDTLESHLFFNWNLEAINNKTLRAFPPEGLQESSPGRDLINLLKSKARFEDYDAISKTSLLKRYTEPKEPKPAEFWKYVPETEDDKGWFTKALEISVWADQKTEQEFVLFTQHYFPGLEEHVLTLNDGTRFPVRDLFNITSFLAKLSRNHIEAIDLTYKEGVNDYDSLHPLSGDALAIRLGAFIHKGDQDAINETLDEHFNEGVREDNNRTIAFAKENIKNENCLIRLERQKLIHAMQWIFQYESEFIEKVLNVFTFDPHHTSDVTHSPFFKLGGDLLWMPNLVAYASFAENLIENILSKKLMTLHGIQTKYYEASLKNTFKAHGYKIIENDADKVISVDGDDIGDFDLLAWKDRHLILMQLKLTNTRNDYKSRTGWKQKLLEAAKQIKTCEDFIEKNQDHIKKILQLMPSEIVEKVSSFIVSNSFLYDREQIDGYLKISCTEVLEALRYVEYTKPYDVGNVERYVNFIRENKLFGKLETLPTIAETSLPLKNHLLLRPIVLPKTVYGNL